MVEALAESHIWASQPVAPLHCGTCACTFTRSSVLHPLIISFVNNAAHSDSSWIPIQDQPNERERQRSGDIIRRRLSFGTLIMAMIWPSPVLALISMTPSG